MRAKISPQFTHQVHCLELAAAVTKGGKTFDVKHLVSRALLQIELFEIVALFPNLWKHKFECALVIEWQFSRQTLARTLLLILVGAERDEGNLCQQPLWEDAASKTDSSPGLIKEACKFNSRRSGQTPRYSPPVRQPARLNSRWN